MSANLPDGFDPSATNLELAALISVAVLNTTTTRDGMADDGKVRYGVDATLRTIPKLSGCDYRLISGVHCRAKGLSHTDLYDCTLFLLNP